MSGPDSFYTPEPLADKLVEYISREGINSAIDFCVGDGDLLKAVAKRFQWVRLYGTDISNEAIAKLRSDCPQFVLAECDFRDDDSVEKVDFLRGKAFDLILMNPPFTCKGSLVESLEFEGQVFKVSTAMFFLMRALRFLSVNGGLYAIMPISCVYSQKDNKAWEYLKTHYHACILEESSRVSFSKDCAPNIVLVYAGMYAMPARAEAVKVDFSELPVVSVIRGSVKMQHPVYSLMLDAAYLIHTTNIQNGQLIGLRRIQSAQSQMVTGYGVVIPRVCNPHKNKIALLDGIHYYVLSDCVMLLQTSSMEDAVTVRNHILEHWDEFLTIYKGTGAQYTTLSRCNELFGKR